MFTELSGRHAAELNEALGRIGFRRSQSVAYRPSCIECSACVSVRVLAAEFEATATQRKILRRHAGLKVSACKPWTTDEQYQLLRRYLPSVIRAAAWRKWTRATSPTWSSRRRSTVM